MCYETEAQLRRCLLLLKAELERVDERHWHRRISKMLESQSADAREVLSWFGGAGSLSDLWIDAANGHRVTDAERDAANARVSSLRLNVYDTARRLR